MAGALSKRRRQEDAPYWPGFVDAMAQLLLVITFLLSVFMVAQFLLAREISGQDSALGQLRSQISGDSFGIVCVANRAHHCDAVRA